MGVLTLWVAISPTAASNAEDSFHEWKFLYCISIRISLKVVPNDLIDNKSALVQVMAWRRAGAKPLPEPLLTQFTNTCMRH